MLIVSDSQIKKLANSCTIKYNRPFHGFHCHLGWGSVAAKITSNVWEIVLTFKPCNSAIIQPSLTKIVSSNRY